MIDKSDDEIRLIVHRVVAQFIGAAAQESAAQGPEPAVPAHKIVAIGADHGGYELKEIIKQDLATLGYEVLDAGTHSKEPVDYPDPAHEVARAVSTGSAWRGIILDGAGIGSCIVANKLPGIRAGLAYDQRSAVNGREHNDTNVLTLGAGSLDANLAKQIVTVWLSTPFGGGRHERRVNKITAIEKLYAK